LTGQTQIKYWVRALRTGSNFKIGWRDSGLNVIEHTPNILVSNEWQQETVDISGVSDANKDAIDRIIFTVLNADAANVVYLDDMFSPAFYNNMTLISESFEAEAEPTWSRLIFIMEDVDAATINTDIKAYVSLDDGTNWELITLADEGDFETGKKIIVGEEKLTARSDKTMRYKITTLNNKNIRIHAAGLLWG